MFFLVVPLHVVFNQRQPIEPGIKRRSDHESTRLLALDVTIKSNEDGGDDSGQFLAQANKAFSFPPSSRKKQDREL
jgi:hypothetical protein